MVQDNDLISRAAAIEAAVRLTTFKNENELDKFVEDNDYGDYYLGGIYDVIDEIKELPAVYAVPVVHAHWVETAIPANTTGHGGVGQDKKKGWLCPKCRSAFDAKLLWIKNYCPGCGAKMEFGGIK